MSLQKEFSILFLVKPTRLHKMPLAQEDLWKLSSDKREVFFLLIAIYCLISTQTYCNQRVEIAGL